MVASAAVAVWIVAAVLHELVDWPAGVRDVAVAASVLVPLSLALSASERMATRIDRLLVHTITMAGLAVALGVAGMVSGREPSLARPAR